MARRRGSGELIRVSAATLLLATAGAVWAGFRLARAARGISPAQRA